MIRTHRAHHRGTYCPLGVHTSGLTSWGINLLEGDLVCWNINPTRSRRRASAPDPGAPRVSGLLELLWEAQGRDEPSLSGFGKVV